MNIVYYSIAEAVAFVAILVALIVTTRKLKQLGRILTIRHHNWRAMPSLLMLKMKRRASLLKRRRKHPPPFLQAKQTRNLLLILQMRS
ncbi:hypothetical protein AI28_19705 [bacteria symbiont BFo1 of Frankliniella occidentalis]|nr:hypothetical protein AI28_19705 [bacteria symbiont BFo1 of Frankliniella occidentalis]